jgi:hypothetical protein
MNRAGIKGFASVLALALAMASIPGCGYQMGSIMHPQIKTIAIAPIKNETLEPYGSAAMRGALCEQFVVDGSLKVTSLEKADCILYGRITNVKARGTLEDAFDNGQTYRAAEWTATVTFEFEVVIPGRKKPLIEKRIVSGTAQFQVMADQQATRRRGMKQACADAARQAVIYTVEAW